MIEVLVATAILAIVSAGLGTAIYGLMSSQNTITRRMDGSEFVSSLSKALSSKKACGEMMEDVPLPAPGPAFVALQLSKYDGYGSRPGAAVRTGFVPGAVSSNPAVVVSELSWRRKPDSSPETFSKIPPEDKQAALGKLPLPYIRQMVQIRVGIQVRRTDGSGMESLPHRYIEFPVVARSNSNVVEDCEGDITVEDTCQYMDAKVDETMKECQPSTVNCTMQGSYTNSWCNRYDFPCRARMQNPPKNNPRTGGASCPAGSTPSTSFSYSWISQEKAGKKSSVNIQNNVHMVLCMKCPPKAN